MSEFKITEFATIHKSGAVTVDLVSFLSSLEGQKHLAAMRALREFMEKRNEQTLSHRS